MKIRITRDTGIPLVDAGRVFEVCGISYGVRNEKFTSSTTAETNWESAPKIAK